MTTRWLGLSFIVFSTAVSQVIYPLNQLHEENFINCNSGEKLIGQPLKITNDGACSINSFGVSKEGYYLYTLFFTNITTNMYVYVNGVQYFFNSSSQLNRSLLVQIPHYQSGIDEQLSSIDIIPIQGPVFLQRIIIEISNNTFQEIIYKPRFYEINNDDLKIDIQNIQVVNFNVKISLKYNQTLLQYTQPSALENYHIMQLDILNDSLVCAGNLQNQDLLNHSLFSDVYNVSFIFNTQQIGFQQSFVTQQQTLYQQSYLIQVLNYGYGSTDYEILDPKHPVIKTNTELIVSNASNSTYQINVYNKQYSCYWTLTTPIVTLQAEHTIYYIIPTQQTSTRCAWLLNLPSNIERQQYNLTFETQIKDTNFQISEIFQVNLEQEPNPYSIQYAITVYIICLMSAFIFMIPCTVFVNKMNILNHIDERKYSLFVYSCFNEALNPTNQQDLTYLGTAQRESYSFSDSASAAMLPPPGRQQLSQIESGKIDQPCIDGALSSGLSENNSQVHQPLIINPNEVISNALLSKRIQIQQSQEDQKSSSLQQDQAVILDVSFSSPANLSPRSQNRPKQCFSSSNNANLSDSRFAQQDQSPLQTPYVDDRQGFL